MDIGLWSGVLGTILTLASLVYAIYATRKSRREKRLVYELLDPIPIIEALGEGNRFRILIEFAGQTGPRELAGGVYAYYVRFANVGREPVRGVDNVGSDPLRIEVSGTEVFDVSLVQATRDVCEISLADSGAQDNATFRRSVNFSFLDQADGALIQILASDPRAAVLMQGTIIGMPEGLKVVGSIEKAVREDSGRFGCISLGLLQVLSIIAVPVIFRWQTGSWVNWWLLLLPVVALAMPIIALLVSSVLTTFRYYRRRGYPIGMEWSLKPPGWYDKRRRVFRLLEGFYGSKAEKEMKSEENDRSDGS